MSSAGMPPVSSGRRTARFTLFGIGTIRGLKTEVPLRVIFVVLAVRQLFPVYPQTADMWSNVGVRMDSRLTAV
jgi:hypothetical protein